MHVDFLSDLRELLCCFWKEDMRFRASAAKKAYLIEKNMPADRLLQILKQAEEERKSGVQVNISIMKKNKKFQKEQMTTEGYTEFVEFFK